MNDHPVYLVWNGNLERSRLTTLVRPILVIPHIVWSLLYGIAVSFALVAGWLVAIFTGRLPGGIHRFAAGHLIYCSRMNAYLMLISNTYPPFSDDGQYELELVVPSEPVKQSRLSVFFRYLLVLPVVLLLELYLLAVNITTMVAWPCVVVLGRMPQGLQNFGMKGHQFADRVAAYSYLLTGRYPTADGVPTATPSTPVDPPYITSEPAPAVVG